MGEALATLSAATDKLAGAFGGDRREWHATMLANKGLMLEALGRGSEAIAVYDDIVARFGEAYEQSVRDLVTKAVTGKERVLEASKSTADASTPDDTVSNFPQRELEEALDALIEAVGKPLK